MEVGVGVGMYLPGPLHGPPRNERNQVLGGGGRRWEVVVMLGVGVGRWW